jgi:hypothetical protein
LPSNERIFFSEEKKQKTFMSLSRFFRKRAPWKQKSFGSFLQKRTASFLHVISTTPRPGNPGPRWRLGTRLDRTADCRNLLVISRAGVTRQRRRILILRQCIRQPFRVRARCLVDHVGGLDISAVGLGARGRIRHLARAAMFAAVNLVAALAV